MPWLIALTLLKDYELLDFGSKAVAFDTSPHTPW